MENEKTNNKTVNVYRWMYWLGYTIAVLLGLLILLYLGYLTPLFTSSEPQCIDSRTRQVVDMSHCSSVPGVPNGLNASINVSFPIEWR